MKKTEGGKKKGKIRLPDRRCLRNQNYSVNCGHQPFLRRQAVYWWKDKGHHKVIYLLSCVWLLQPHGLANIDSIWKNRDITLPTKARLVKAVVFPVVMYGCENWTINKAECWRIDAFQLCCWRRCLRVLWTARRSNQSILKKISPEYSLEGLMPKLKLQHFGHLMWRADWFEKTLMLGKIEGGRRSGWQRMRWLDGITDMGLGGLWELVMDREAWRVVIHGFA